MAVKGGVPTLKAVTASTGHTLTRLLSEGYGGFAGAVRWPVRGFLPMTVGELQG
jgi:hypothetical protein